MQLFYIDPSLAMGNEIVLPEESSRHIVSVLRMKQGDSLQLTTGKGTLYHAIIEEPHKKKCRVSIVSAEQFEKPSQEIVMAVSLLKNTGRYEWFLEKATEIGATRIVPLLCARTEKQQFRYNRLHTILISAMMQSGRYWLPELEQPVAFPEVFSKPYYSDAAVKMIAHCMEGEKRDLVTYLRNAPFSRMMFIGPEGDFTAEEVRMAEEYGAVAVSLGNTRLRTETACIVATTLMMNVH